MQPAANFGKRVKIRKGIREARPIVKSEPQPVVVVPAQQTPTKESLMDALHLTDKDLKEEPNGEELQHN
jgi:hypothetical protein